MGGTVVDTDVTTCLGLLDGKWLLASNEQNAAAI